LKAVALITAPDSMSRTYILGNYAQGQAISIQLPL
jgi:hypothetical protein